MNQRDDHQGGGGTDEGPVEKTAGAFVKVSERAFLAGGVRVYS